MTPPKVRFKGQISFLGSKKFFGAPQNQKNNSTEYSNGGGKKCVPMTRKKCNDMVEQVPKQTFDQECKTEYTEECSHPKASLYGSTSDPNYSS